MATALENWKAYLEADANKLANAYDKLKALQYIESWYNTFLATEALRSQNITSYSLNGRSVSRQNLSSLKAELQNLQYQIEDILYMRGIILADARGFYTAGWPVAGGTVAT